MAPDDVADGAATQLELPGVDLERGAAGANLAMRGTSNTPDIAAKGVQP
jgi:hypothetical protein